MPNVSVTLKLVYESGQEQVQMAGVSQPQAQRDLSVERPAASPYRVPNNTAPVEPTIVQSTSFAKVG